MPELLLIRHAETDFNRQLRFQGHLDAPLNANGLAQAARLAERLADEPIDLIVASDLQRALQTAEPLAARRRLALRPAEAGMHLVGYLEDGTDDRALAERAGRLGVGVTPLAALYQERPDRSGLLLGYAGLHGSEIEHGLRGLARAFELPPAG